MEFHAFSVIGREDAVAQRRHGEELMGAMTMYRGDSIDGRFGALPPVPAAWTRRAKELPLLGQALGLLDEWCPRADLAEHRQEVDAALREVGLEPDEQRVQMLGRLRLLRCERQGQAPAA
jgi:hypothetical protein